MNNNLLDLGRHRLVLDKVILPYGEKNGVCFLFVPFNNQGKEVTRTFHELKSNSSLREFLTNLFQFDVDSIPDPDLLRILEGQVLEGTIARGNPGYVNLLNDKEKILQNPPEFRT